MGTGDDNLADLREGLRGQIEALAESLLGPRNKSLSNRRTLRFGSKGSMAVEIAGNQRGAWFDHEAGVGNGPIDLIRHVQGNTLAEAVDWARIWLGDPEARPAPIPRPARASVDDPERQAAIADARRMWEQSGPIAGTVAEKYLVDTRKIPAPMGGWPGMVIRFFASELSLIVAATTADGVLQAVQRIRLGRDGLKADDGRPVKLSRGPQDGAMVRLPGDPTGPLLIAEGPETGLSAWRATGFQTWVALGSVSKADLPMGRRVVICGDDDRRRAIAGKDANAHKRLTAALADWKAAGLDVVVAYPWPIRRGNGSDLNDLLQAEGIDAVRARIMLALNPAGGPGGGGRVTLKVARAQLGKAVDGFMDRALAWLPPEEPETAVPPVEAIKVDVGAGKSHFARIGLVRLITRMRGVISKLRAAGDQRTAAILIPTHKLGNEQLNRIEALPEAAGLKVKVWRGRTAQNPDDDGATMCLDLPAVKLATSVGLDPQTAVCRRILDGTEAKCQFFDICAYQGQRQARADIWLGAHELLFTTKPAAMGTLAAVVIDESFWQAGLGAETQFPLDLLETGAATVPGNPMNTDRLRFLRQMVLYPLKKHEAGAVLRDRLVSAGLTPANAGEARAMEWQRKIDVGMVPGMPLAARKEAATAAATNRDVMRLAGFWKAAETLVADGGAEASGWITLDQDEEGARIVKLKGRGEVTAGWQAPTLILDAILDLDLVRPYFRQVRLVADLAVEAPYQRVRQITDKAYSLNMLAPPSEYELSRMTQQEAEKEVRRRAHNLKNLRALLIREARRVRPGRVLVVLQKRVEEALLALGQMPPNVAVAHHNAIAGRDEWGDVRLLVVVGRTSPRPNDVTKLAEALTGSALPLLDGWYPRGDAIRETLTGAELADADRHPDPLAEAIRWQICVGELVQIVGRGRGVNRTAANPLDVLVMCDVPLPLPVAETMPAAALDPNLADHMQAAGGVTFENPAHAARAYPDMWPNAEAAKKALQRERTGTFPYKKLLIGECPPPLAQVAYQLAGPGQKPAMCWCDPEVVPNPAAWLAARLGPMAWVGDPPIAPPPTPRACNPVPPAPGEPSHLGRIYDPEPGLIYRGPVIEIPPSDLLVVRGRDRVPIAVIEVPAMGPFMGARAFTPAGLGPWLMLRRPDDPPIPHPAFIGPTRGALPWV